MAVALAGILIDRNRDMPFNDLEKKRIENALGKFLAKRRPLPNLRKELDVGYCLSGKSKYPHARFVSMKPVESVALSRDDGRRLQWE